MNWKHILVAIVFFLFGIVQINDPDPWIWVLIYFALALAILSYAFKKVSWQVFLFLTSAYATSSCFYLPEFFDWMASGFPSITGSMKAENPQIEWVREFLGLVLCSLVSFWYFRKSKSTI